MISTKTHGMIDYLTSAILVVLPRLMGWGGMPRTLLTNAGLGGLAYSLLTRYEPGAVKLLPMPVHLTLDMASGSMLCAASVLLKNEDPTARSALLGIGLGEIAASLITEPQPAETLAPS